MIREYEILITEDGSDTLRLKGTEITFHSTKGAIQESNHVFIETGFRYFLNRNAKKSIAVFEVGFGTGLNALLTAKAAMTNSRNVVYYGIDNYPLPVEIYSRLNYPAILNEGELYKIIMQTDWNQLLFINAFFKLKKIREDWKSHLLTQTFDIIYFDAFAPDDQEEMWTEDIYKKMYDALCEGGVLVTYCSKSKVRKGLEQVGFIVEKLEGPPGKREIIRVIK